MPPRRKRSDRYGHRKKTSSYQTLPQEVSRSPKPPSLPAPVPRRAVQLLTAYTPRSETPRTGSISWHNVATHLPGRNNKDCRKRWNYSLAHTIRKGTWSKEEDAKLLEAVEKYGFRWSKVAKAVGSRNGDQVFKRWGDCLDPRIDKSPWTGAEVSKQRPLCTRATPFFRWIGLTVTTQDEKLLQQVALTGRNWSEMVANHFPNRTALSAKNRYSILLRKQGGVREPRLRTPTSAVQSPSASAMDDGSSTCTFAEFEMLSQQQQQPWNWAPDNMPETWSCLNGTPSGDIVDPAAMASPFTAVGPGVGWTTDYTNGTPAFAESEHQLQLAQFPSPVVMSVDSLPGVGFGETYRADWSTGSVGDGGQDMVGGGDPTGGQCVGYYNPAWFVC